MSNNYRTGNPTYYSFGTTDFDTSCFEITNNMDYFSRTYMTEYIPEPIPTPKPAPCPETPIQIPQEEIENINKIPDVIKTEINETTLSIWTQTIEMFGVRIGEFKIDIQPNIQQITKKY